MDWLDWLKEHAWESWLGLAIVLGVAEMLSLDLVLAMLAAGALVGMLAAVLDLPLAVQALAAVLSSAAMLMLVRPSIAKRLHHGPELVVGHGKLVGTQGKVTEEISGLQAGRVRLGGEIWSALPYDESVVIAPGETVEVLQIRGATAYVHPVPTLES
ncbi:NfeD family protein [Nocardioides pacificus]